MNEAVVTIDQAGNALATAFRVAYQSLDLMKLGRGDGDFRGGFMAQFRTLAVYVAEADGPLSPAERIAIDQIFWLDHGDLDATSRANADDPGAVETAIQFLCTMVTNVQRANVVLGTSTDAASNPVLLAADQVFRGVLAADVSGPPDTQRFEAVMARLKLDVPAPSPAPNPAIAASDLGSTTGTVRDAVSAPVPQAASALPPVDCPARLHDGEFCRAVSDAVLFQESNVVRNVRYGGLSGRVRIMRGVSYRIGSYDVDRTRAPKLERIAAGTLCITDQRLIFLSNTKNLDLPFARLLSCATEPGIIEVTRANSGRTLFEDLDLAALQAFEQLTGTSPDNRETIAADLGQGRPPPAFRIGRLIGRGLIATIGVSLLLLYVVL